MTSHNIRRDDVDALFAGLPPAPGSGLDGVALLFSSLRAAARDDVPSGVEERHLAAITRTVAEVPGSEKRTRIRFRALFAPALVKVAALVMFVLVAGGALAATGNIPAYQDKVADALSFVVNLPGGSDEVDEEHPQNPARDVQDGPDGQTEVEVIEQGDVTSDGEQGSGSQETESSSGSRLDIEGSAGSGSENERSETDSRDDTGSRDESDEGELDDDGASDDTEIDD